jgi:hypothetical protein
VGWFAWRRCCAAPFGRAFNGARAVEDLQNVLKFGHGRLGRRHSKETPGVDIIDLLPFQSYHHTAPDTLDKCSPAPQQGRARGNGKATCSNESTLGPG